MRDVASKGGKPGSLLERLLRRAPEVPDPGQRVRLMGPDGAWRGGFVAISGPLSDDRYGVVVRVAKREEVLAASDERRRPVALSWPLEMLDIED